MVSALNRALAKLAVLTAAGDAHGVDPALLGAIGLRETGFRNINQPNGQGVGLFQIDLGQNPSVTAGQASNVAFAANWAAAYLSGNAKDLAANYPDLSTMSLAGFSGYGDMSVIAPADTYNLGLGGVKKFLNNTFDPDLGTTGENYGQNVWQLTKCF